MREPAGRPGATGEAAPVLLAEGTEFDGLLALDGPARIDGRLRGEVIGSGPLWIGPRANVEARIETDEVVVAGALAGEVKASRRIALGGTARVRGELSTPSLALAEGALLEGRCTAGSPEVAGGEGPDPAPASS